MFSIVSILTMIFCIVIGLVAIEVFFHYKEKKEDKKISFKN